MLNRLARERLESAFPLCWVAGEISNLTYASSGHAYFSLKDAAAQVRCVMFRNRTQCLGWRLENGQHVEARVLVTLYEARGDFQLNVETVRKAGIGNLYENFLHLKARLETEGLFSPAGKRPLPRFPRRIGIVTSPQAAALRDVLTTLARRAPHISLVIYPTPVQGENAAASIALAIRTASRRRECDLLILCRGGGSLEDLWAFNDEALARTLRASSLPVITGIGHETDFTIADFAADERAPTPTAAAEMAALERSAWTDALLELHRTLQRQSMHQIAQRHQQIDGLALRLRHPRQYLAAQHDRLCDIQHRLNGALAQTGTHGRRVLAHLTQRFLLARPKIIQHTRQLEALAPKIRQYWQQTMNTHHQTLLRLATSLAHLNPKSVMARGYSIVTNGEGKIVRDSRTLEPNAHIAVCFYRGRAEATINSTSKEERLATDREAGPVP